MLILLRHGRTAVNAGGRLQGRMNEPLDDAGRMQALAAGRHIRERFGDVQVISSPLVRATATASAISDDVKVDERFIELDYGTWDGMELSQVPAAEWAAWRNDPAFAPPGGESLHQLDDRVRPALAELADRARDAHVVVVSHVSPIKSAVTWALGTGPEQTWRMSLDRASICTVSIGPRGPVLSSFNETGHLSGLPG